MYKEDQSIRMQLIELSKAVTTEGQSSLIDSLVAVIEKQHQIDQRNIAFVDSLLQIGLPQGLSKAAYNAIWIIIDHSDLTSQEKHLPFIKQMVDEDKIKFKDYATLYDRIEMNNNRPQQYGTQLIQFGTPDSLQLYLWPVENIDILDSLRHYAGFDSISKYLDAVSNTMGIKVNYNPNLTIQELNNMKNQHK